MQGVLAAAEHNLSNQTRIGGMLGVDNGVTFEQFSPGPDHNNTFGNCLYQAFAWARFGTDDNWTTAVREPTRNWWYQVMADQNSQRRAMYTALNVQSGRTLAPGGRSPGTYIQDDNLADQMGREELWGSVDMIQILADAFQVEILMHVPQISTDGGPTVWEVHSRGIHGSPQIHLVNYYNYHHWTALRPDDGALRYNHHTFGEVDARIPIAFFDQSGLYSPGKEPSPIRPGENGERATGSNAPLPADDEGFEGPTNDDPSDNSLFSAQNEVSGSGDGESEDEESSLPSYEHYERQDTSSVSRSV